MNNIKQNFKEIRSTYATGRVVIGYLKNKRLDEPSPCIDVIVLYDSQNIEEVGNTLKNIGVTKYINEDKARYAGISHLRGCEEGRLLFIELGNYPSVADERMSSGAHIMDITNPEAFKKIWGMQGRNIIDGYNLREVKLLYNFKNDNGFCIENVKVMGYRSNKKYTYINRGLNNWDESIGVTCSNVDKVLNDQSNSNSTPYVLLCCDVPVAVYRR